MVSIKKISEEKLFYSIGEVAILLKVNSSLIRFWETEFKQIKPKKNKKGDRFFTKKDIELLQTIYDLVKNKGFTLDGAKKYLSNKTKYLTETSSLAQANQKEKVDVELITQKMEAISSFLKEVRATL